MDVHQRDQPHAGKVFRRQRMAHVKRPGIPPRPAPVDARFPGALRVQTERAQARFAGAGAFPLPPGDDAQATTDPRVQFLKGRPTLRMLEVIHRAAQERPPRLDGPLQRAPASPQAPVRDPCAQACEAFRRDAQRGVLVHGHAITQELALPGPRHRALGRDPGHDPFPRAFVGHADVAVVSVPAESQSAPFQFAIQIGQQDVRQQRGQRSALRRALRPGCLNPVGHQVRLQEAADQGQDAPVLSTSWFTQSKNCSQSMSATQCLPSRMYPAARRTACPALRPG